MSHDTLATYDELPYDSLPFAETHPDNLAATATLFGMEPAPVESCRVLELGCAGGGNLIPMAEALPGSRFVGIDLSRRQISDGREIVDRLGLTNLELRHASILDVDAGYGLFDYVICHGVYSWVPAAVQNKILCVCKENLAPRGVAIVSYNLYPGWHLKGIVRDWLGYHDRPVDPPDARVRRARLALEALLGYAQHMPDTYGGFLREELALLGRQADSYLLHEHLEETNHPIPFHEFVGQAAAHGLQYLGEAQLFGMATSNFAPDVEKALRALAGDVVRLEQYMDFVRNRPFRETLLCHRDIPLDWSLKPDRLAGMYLASPLRPALSDPDLHSLEPVQFSRPDGFQVSTWDPLLKAAFVGLGNSWPRAVSLDELWSTTRSLLGRSAGPASQPDDGERRAQAMHLLRCLTANLLELHAYQPRFVREVSQHPAASPWARLQAQARDRVTNRRHELVPLDPHERRVLELLDGSRSLASILAAMTGGGEALEGAAVETILARLAACALLVN
jgi:methyltransferase-like protein/SAM-dependent methyltransferase